MRLHSRAQALDAQALLARCARVILADLRLPLDLGAQAGARRAEAVELGEEIPVESVIRLALRVGSSLVLIGRQQDQASQFHLRTPFRNMGVYEVVISTDDGWAL